MSFALKMRGDLEPQGFGSQAETRMGEEWSRDTGELRWSLWAESVRPRNLRGLHGFGRREPVGAISRPHTSGLWGRWRTEKGGGVPDCDGVGRLFWIWMELVARLLGLAGTSLGVGAY